MSPQSVLPETTLREILSDLAPGHRPALFHLIHCETCRVWAASTLVEEQGIRLLLPSEDVPACLDGDEAGQLLDEELDAADTADELEAIGARLGPEEALAMLLRAGQKSQLVDPASSERIALLAMRFVSMKGVSSPADLATTAILVANARRLAGKLSEAEAALGNALPCSDSPLERARSERVMALIRWERGQSADAASLFRQAARGFGELRSIEEEAATSTLLGLLHLEDGPPYTEALPALFAGLTVLGGTRPWLAVRGSLSLALVLATHGRPMEAEALAIGGRRAISDEDEALRILWLEARVWGRVGQWERALNLLLSVHRKLVEAGQFPEAVLSAFDVAHGLAGTAQLPRIETLARELGTAFPTEPMLGDALTELEGIRWDDPMNLAERAELTASALRKRLRRSGLRFQPIPFA